MNTQSLLASAHTVLDETPPPTLREILGAYRSKGDGDRELLLAMLNAKTAEDQRIAQTASLHRTLLELYSNTSSLPPLNLPTNPPPPPPSFTSRHRTSPSPNLYSPYPRPQSRSPPLPPSPHSSRGTSDSSSPRSAPAHVLSREKGSMNIGSLLSQRVSSTRGSPPDHDDSERSRS